MTDIEGSKPRKLITKTKLTNPSLYSVGLTSLLDPENQSLSKIYEALEKKQKITVDREAKLFQLSPQKSEMETKGRREIPRQMQNRQQPIQGGQDSLQMATREFQQKRKEQVEAVQARRGAFQRQISGLSRGSSLPSLMPLNYRSSREIMHKQKSEYNIISNL